MHPLRLEVFLSTSHVSNIECSEAASWGLAGGLVRGEKEHDGVFFCLLFRGGWGGDRKADGSNLPKLQG